MRSSPGDANVTIERRGRKDAEKVRFFLAAFAAFAFKRASVSRTRRLVPGFVRGRIVYWCAVADACTVVIGAPDLLPSLKRRTPAGDGEILAFSYADALQALQVISQRRPRMVTLERYFADTPRGAALINRIKADPALANAEIRVVSHEGDYTRVLSRDTAAASAVRPNSSAAPPPQGSARTAPALNSRTPIPRPSMPSATDTKTNDSANSDCGLRMRIGRAGSDLDNPDP